MIPYILAAVGGYLIGDSMKKQYADGGMMAIGGEIFVGRFDENQLRKKEDKSAIEKAQKESGYKYIKSKMVKKSGKPYMEVYLVKDPNQATFADGGMMAKGGKIKKLYAILVSPMGEMIADVEVTDTDERKAREKFREMGITQSGSIRFSNNQPHYYEQGGKTSM